MNDASRLLLLSLLALPPSAFAINVCTDASGKTIYQQQPCLSLAPRQENAPVATQAITPAIANETIRRFRASLTPRQRTCSPPPSPHRSRRPGEPSNTIGRHSPTC
jgi:hypothetical protein